MGCCQTTESKHSDAVDLDLRAAQKEDVRVIKLLFFGKSGSGKSTSSTQLRMIHGQSFLDKDRLRYKDYISGQIIQQMKLLIENYEDSKEEYPEEFGHLTLSNNGAKSAEFIDFLRNDVDINDDIAKHIEMLWKEPTIKKIFAHRSRVNIKDSSAYYFDNINRIASKSYIPTDNDILLVRRPTNGIIEQRFEVHQTTYHILDISAQMCSTTRSKWIHCFEHVSAVLFVASLSSYDHILYEDYQVTQMEQSLDYFEEICNLRWFVYTPMILILNKSDLFAAKIKRVSLSVCFPDYNGSNSYDECVEYIKRQFEQRNRNSLAKQVYTYVMCAVDRDCVRNVFNDISHIVVNTSLQKNGII